MLVAIDFGISNTDIAVSENEETSFFSTPTLSTTISPDTIKELFKKHNIPISSVQIIGVTGGKSSDLDNSLEEIKIIKINEIEAIGLGAKKI